MTNLVRFSLAQTVFYNLIFVLLSVAGAYALISLPVERYPEVNFGEVIISTDYPGASPADVEALITTKIEDALEDLQDVEYIAATSYRERSIVQVKFVDDTDYDFLYNELRFKVLSMLDELPREANPPEMFNIKISDVIPMGIVNLAGEHSNRALSLMAEEMRTVLRRIDGIEKVNLLGEYIREFHVFLDPEKMAAAGVTFDEAANALERANLSIPSGKFTDRSGEFMVRVDEKFRSVEQVTSTIIRRDGDGAFVTIQDIITDASLSYRKPFVITSVNGKDSVSLQLSKSKNGSALTIARQVGEIIEEFRLKFEGEGVDIVLTQDSTIKINDGIRTLGSNLLLGIILVSIIIWYFMGWRNAGLTIVGIPFAFLVTMVIMQLTGNSINDITLFAFVLVTGIIVDDSIVVVENIYRHVQEGKEVHQAVVEGTSEVMLPVIAATSTTVAAFLPMLLMTGSTGEFFAQIPMAISFAIVASLIECLLILPVHYLDFGPKPEDAAGKEVMEKDNFVMKVLRMLTDKIIRITMRFRAMSLFLVAIAFVAAIAILGVSVSGKLALIKIKFFPDDYSLYYVDIEGPANTSIETISAKVKTIAEFVLRDGPGMADSAASFAGTYVNDDYQNIFANNVGMVMVTLPSKHKQQFDDPLKHLEKMRERLNAEFATSDFTLRIHAQKDGPPTGKAINVRVVGTDFQSIDGMAADIFSYMHDDPELGPYLTEREDDRGQPSRVFRFEVKQARAHEYGLDTAHVARLAASVLDGRYLGKFRVADEEVDLKLKLAPDFLREPEDALQIPLLEHASGPVRLGDLVRVRAYTEVGDLSRYQGQRAITLLANIKSGAPISTPVAVSKIKAYYEKIRRQYPGANITFGGAFEDTQRSYTSLAYAFGVAVLVMYLILATQFQSYLQPLIILSAIVFSLIGVIFGKFITQSFVTVNTFIAVLGVAGVVVNDALVLIDFINRRYRKGMSRAQAIDEGIRARLRPIVLTTLTTSLGLLPMALGIPSYSIVWGDMASTFVTGLAMATALTLFIVPVQWDLLEGLKQRSLSKSLKMKS
ncbi:MAG: efflux RND transporter permease subunit [Gammaproteobacteria bacterium]|nr:efflux RND transporter permease subunit [Gammaproteobacteria bacterium]